MVRDGHDTLVLVVVDLTMICCHAGRVHPMPIVFGLGAERQCCVVWLVDASMGFCYFASRSRLLSVLAPQR